MAQLGVDQFDLLFGVRDLCRLKCLQIADIFELEVFQSGFMVRVKSVPHRRQFVVRSDGKGVCIRIVSCATGAKLVQMALTGRSHAKLAWAHLSHVDGLSLQGCFDGGSCSHRA